MVAGVAGGAVGDGAACLASSPADAVRTAVAVLVARLPELLDVRAAVDAIDLTLVQGCPGQVELAAQLWTEDAVLITRSRIVTLTGPGASTRSAS